MIIQRNLIEIDADVELAWAAALSDEQLDNLTHTSLLEEEPEIYSIHADVILTISTGKINGLIAGEVDRINVNSTQAEVQSKIEKLLSTCLD